jgi:hypothetical protein
MLYISPLENEAERINEVNLFRWNGKGISMIDVNDHTKFPEAFPRFIYVASFNYFKLDEFINHLQNDVAWEYPEYVQLIVQEESDNTLKFYTHAGKILLVDSIK